MGREYIMQPSNAARDYVWMDSIAVIPDYVILKGGKKYALLTPWPEYINHVAAIVKNAEDPYVSLMHSMLDFTGDEILDVYIHAKTRRENEHHMSARMNLKSGAMNSVEPATGLLFSLIGSKKLSVEQRTLKSRKSTDGKLWDNESEFLLDDIEFTPLNEVKYTHRAECKDDRYSTVSYKINGFDEDPVLALTQDEPVYAVNYSGSVGRTFTFRPVPPYPSVETIIRKNILDKQIKTFSLNGHLTKTRKPKDTHHDTISAFYEILRRNNTELADINIYLGTEVQENVAAPAVRRATTKLKKEGRTQTFENTGELAIALSIFGGKEMGMKTAVLIPDSCDHPYIY